jgi:hypothetical protein
MEQGIFQGTNFRFYQGLQVPTVTIFCNESGNPLLQGNTVKEETEMEIINGGKVDKLSENKPALIYYVRKLPKGGVSEVSNYTVFLSLEAKKKKEDNGCHLKLVPKKGHHEHDRKKKAKRLTTYVNRNIKRLCRSSKCEGVQR